MTLHSPMNRFIRVRKLKIQSLHKDFKKIQPTTVEYIRIIYLMMKRQEKKSQKMLNFEEKIIFFHWSSFVRFIRQCIEKPPKNVLQ